MCEGEVTEREYFRELKNWWRTNLVTVEVVRGAGGPLPLVRRAATLKRNAERDATEEGDDNLAYDEVWCVYDVDEHAHLDEAERLAAESELSIAVSNPCFELWLLLHRRDQPGQRSSRAMQELCEKAGVIAGKNVVFDGLEDGYDVAVRRADRLCQDAEAMGEPGRNPTTTVYRLTESIRVNALERH